uniref:Uncharacterized protein n=2 Tax=Timema TaxID=61471 RepID=A0A7R9NUQ7_9NEOP|nr:unnamed protein product [Timema bartmani]CAD7457110.1 unnamed protein product [Timema tahoe]
MRTKITQLVGHSTCKAEELEFKLLSWHYLSQEYEKNINQYTGSVDLGGQDSEHEDCMRINAEWNAEVAAEREKRLVRQGEERKMIILQTLIDAEKRQQERVQKADKIVRKEKVR